MLTDREEILRQAFDKALPGVKRAQQPPRFPPERKTADEVWWVFLAGVLTGTFWTAIILLIFD